MSRPRTGSSRSSRLSAVVPAVVALLGVSLAVAPGATAADPGTVAATVAAALPPGGSFVPVAPTRVLDTRQGGGTTHYADVDTSPALPRNGTSGVAAVLLNVTVVDAFDSGYVTVGTAAGTSNGNFVARKPSATLALVPYSRLIRITPSVPADIVVDVQGYVTTVGAATSASFTPLDTARRVADTRTGSGLQPFTPGQTQQLDARRLATLPSDATAVVANVTVAGATTSTYVTGWSGNGARPQVSTVNAAAGDIVANRALIPLDADGRLSLYNQDGRTDLVVDVVGYLSPDATGSYYTPAPAVRLLDAAATTSASAQPTIVGGFSDATALSPSTRDLAPTTAAWLTVVGDQPVSPGYVSARPGGSGVTGTSDLNMVPSRAVANAGPVRVSGTDGTVALTAQVPARLVVDLSGWFRKVTTPAAGLWRTSVLRSGATGRVDTLPAGLPAAFAAGAFSSTPGFPEAHAYAVQSDGTVAYAALLRSSPAAEPLLQGPVPLGTLTGVRAVVSAGDDLDAATYALDDQGRLFGWQANSYGELASRPTDQFDFNAVSPVQLPGGARATAVFAAPNIGYAVLDDDAHTVLSWGRADTAQLGRDATSTPWKPAAVTFPTGAPVDIAGDGRVSFGIDAAGLTTSWGSPLPADGGSTPTVQATPTPFLGGCLLATSLYADTDGVWELCADGSVVQLTSQGRVFASPQVLPVTGVTAIGPGAGHGTGVRVLLADGRVADATPTAARYEAGFAGVTAVNGTREVQVTLVGS